MSFRLTHHGVFSIYAVPAQEKPETILFSGDIILGSPSTWVEDMSAYMKTLNKLKQIEYEFDLVAVPHSTRLDYREPELVLMEGSPKLDAYIKYRVGSLNRLT